MIAGRCQATTPATEENPAVDRERVGAVAAARRGPRLYLESDLDHIAHHRPAHPERRRQFGPGQDGGPAATSSSWATLRPSVSTAMRAALLVQRCHTG